MSTPHAPTDTIWSAMHRRRLREMWRSAGWPCQDMVEVDLLAGGLLQRVSDDGGRETLRVTEAGLQVLAQTRRTHQGARNPHEALVAHVAREMQRAGRLVWRGLSLRAPLPEDEGRTRWVMAMPDVFSIRHTTREDLVEPIVHEIKVRRADLLSDLRRPDKREAYRQLSSQCWYVLQAGIGQADEIPPEFGVMQAPARTASAQDALAPPEATVDVGFGALEVLRPAPRRSLRLPLATWMALARANAEPATEELLQGLL